MHHNDLISPEPVTFSLSRLVAGKRDLLSPVMEWHSFNDTDGTIM